MAPIPPIWIPIDAKLAKAIAGEDFASLAWDYSGDAFRVKGGDLGLMHRGRMNKKIDEFIMVIDFFFLYIPMG